MGTKTQHRVAAQCHHFCHQLSSILTSVETLCLSVNQLSVAMTKTQDIFKGGQSYFGSQISVSGHLELSPWTYGHGGSTGITSWWSRRNKTKAGSQHPLGEHVSCDFPPEDSAFCESLLSSATADQMGIGSCLYCLVSLVGELFFFFFACLHCQSGNVTLQHYCV